LRRDGIARRCGSCRVVGAGAGGFAAMMRLGEPVRRRLDARRPGPLASAEVSYVPTGRPGVGRRWIHEREIPPLIRWPGRRDRAIRCDHPALAGRRPVRRGLLLRGPGGGPGRHTAHGRSAPRDRAAAMRSPLPRLAYRPGGRPRYRVRAAREFRRCRLVPRRSRPSRPSNTRPVNNTAPDMAMASDEGPFAAVPSSLAARGAAGRH